MLLWMVYWFELPSPTSLENISVLLLIIHTLRILVFKTLLSHRISHDSLEWVGMDIFWGHNRITPNFLCRCWSKLNSGFNMG